MKVYSVFKNKDNPDQKMLETKMKLMTSAKARRVYSRKLHRMRQNIQKKEEASLDKDIYTSKINFTSIGSVSTLSDKLTKYE